MSSANCVEIVRADDFVEYFIFPEINLTNNSNKHDLLNSLLLQINSITEKYCTGYIWHKDEFFLSPRYFGNPKNFIETVSLSTPKHTECDDDLPPHLYGITFYGDNIQDEWFIVSLLFEISRQIPDVIIRCIDNDGEFLLIEAGEHLPKWASADTCEQRVYIYNGSIHLVQNSPSNTCKILPISIALEKLRVNRTVYKVSQQIENKITERTQNYPTKIRLDQHRTKVYLPYSAAKLLQQNPTLISSAVRAFCNRDPIDMKICRAMKYFPPENRCYVSVLFTKCLYAMLKHYKYIPDHKIGWNLPAVSDSNYMPQLLGVKIACGFEILAGHAAKYPLDNFENTAKFQKYVQSLRDSGYFKDFLEYSIDYNMLLNTAKDYYRENLLEVGAGNANGVNDYQQSGHKILKLLQELDTNVDELKENQFNLPEDDNENWLNISAEDLDKMLIERYGEKKIFQLDGNINATTFTNNINEFLEKESEFDGIETDSPIPPKRGVKKTKKSNNKSNNVTDNKEIQQNLLPVIESNKIDFNPDLFQTHINDMLDLVIPEDNWESNSDDMMSEFEEDNNDFDKNMDEININKNKIDMQKYMDEMDRELSRTTIGKSFIVQDESDGKPDKVHLNDDSFDDIENFKPVNIDVNTLQNMADSYKLQFGQSGPASNLLNSIGIHLGGNNAMKRDDDVESEENKYVTQV